MNRERASHDALGASDLAEFGKFRRNEGQL